MKRFYATKSEIGVRLSDRSGIDPATLSLGISDRGSFTLEDPELSFEDGVLLFETGGDVPLGAYGASLTATLAVADVTGNATSYEWSFALEEAVVLADNLLIFGSADAQRAGQRIPQTPTRVLAGDPGPIRANSSGWQLHAVTETTLVVAYETTAPSFPAGQYLTNRTPRSLDEIFYRKVVSTSDDPATRRLTITTESVPASEIMQAGSASLSASDIIFEVDEAGNIIAARVLRAFDVSGEVLIDPIKINWSGKQFAGFYTKPDNSFGADFALPLGKKAPDGGDWDMTVAMKQARLIFTPTLALAVKTSFLEGVEKFYSRANLDVDAVLEAEFVFWSAGLPDFEYKKTLWRHDYVVLLGTTPIWVSITPKLNAKAGFSTGLSGSFSVGAMGGFSDTLIYDYLKAREDRLDISRVIGNFHFDLIDPEIKLGGEVGASASLEPELEVKLISLVGLYANVDPTVYSHLSADFSTGTLFSAEASLGVRANLNAGLAITGFDNGDLPSFDPWPLFDKGWTWNYPVPDTSAPLQIISQPQSVNLQSGATLNLRVATNHTTGVSYEWLKDGRRLFDTGPELIRYGVGTATAGEYQVIVRYGEEQLLSETATVAVNSPDGGTPAGMVQVSGGTLAMSMGTVSVDTFYIGRYEVTWGEWQTVRTWAAANDYDIGSRGAGCADDHPVHSVAWYDVVKWCNAKSEHEGLTPVYTYNGSTYKSGEPTHTLISQNLSANGYRLPQEAEWEFAARGGNQTNGYTYAGSNDLNAVGWYWDNSVGAACNMYSGRGTWPVGQKLPNELGLYDMSGNVWEWCWDQNSSSRRIRGGSWVFYALNCTVSNRYYLYNPDFRISNFGFRIARSSGN